MNPFAQLYLQQIIQQQLLQSSQAKNIEAPVKSILKQDDFSRPDLQFLNNKLTLNNKGTKKWITQSAEKEIQQIKILQEAIQTQQTLNKQNPSVKVENEQVPNTPQYAEKVLLKLKNKCIFNGDNQCSCKKCQCIRRNRNSARESQKKKREALEKIGPLQENFEKLQKKICSLEKENEVLRGLLMEVFRHPSVQKISQQFLEPLSKIIYAETDDITQKQDFS